MKVQIFTWQYWYLKKQSESSKKEETQCFISAKRISYYHLYNGVITLQWTKDIKMDNTHLSPLQWSPIHYATATRWTSLLFMYKIRMLERWFPWTSKCQNFLWLNSLYCTHPKKERPIENTHYPMHPSSGKDWDSFKE